MRTIMHMVVLGIETSCDETSVAVLDGNRILSNVVLSQVKVHEAFGGVVPELASRHHLDNIGWVLEEAVRRSGQSSNTIEGIGATYGPGLVGSLLVGLNVAKAVSYAWNIPFVGVNHLEAHLHSIFLENPEAELPMLCVIASGGHTSLYHLKTKDEYEILGGTRDDAVGEAFDKVAKLLGLGYPGGPVIDRLGVGTVGVATQVLRAISYIVESAGKLRQPLFGETLELGIVGPARQLLQGRQALQIGREDAQTRGGALGGRRARPGPPGLKIAADRLALTSKPRVGVAEGEGDLGGFRGLGVV